MAFVSWSWASCYLGVLALQRQIDLDFKSSRIAIEILLNVLSMYGVRCDLISQLGVKILVYRDYFVAAFAKKISKTDFNFQICSWDSKNNLRRYGQSENNNKERGTQKSNGSQYRFAFDGGSEAWKYKT